MALDRYYGCIVLPGLSPIVAPGVSQDHVQAFPAPQVHDGKRVHASLPEGDGKGAAEAMGVAGYGCSFLQPSQHGMDAVPS